MLDSHEFLIEHVLLRVSGHFITSNISRGVQGWAVGVGSGDMISKFLSIIGLVSVHQLVVRLNFFSYVKLTILYLI